MQSVTPSKTLIRSLNVVLAMQNFGYNATVIEPPLMDYILDEQQRKVWFYLTTNHSNGHKLDQHHTGKRYTLNIIL